MTPEELLKPRYKVVAPMPGLKYTVGEMLKPHPVYGFDIFPFPEKYPHIFTPLEWWEDREKEELPEYVKDEKGKIIKVKNFSQDFILRLSQYKILGKLYPSTEEEYKNQL